MMPATSIRVSLPATRSGSRVITSRARVTTGQSAHGGAASPAGRAGSECRTGSECRVGAYVTASFIVDLPLNEHSGGRNSLSRTWRV